MGPRRQIGATLLLLPAVAGADEVHLRNGGEGLASGPPRLTFA